MEVKAVMFDWFGVICNKAYLQFLTDNQIVGSRLDDLLDLADQVDTGAITLAEFRIKVAGVIGVSAVVVENEIARRVVLDTKVLKLARELRVGHRVGIFSNVNVQFLSELIDENGLQELFIPAVASSELGVSKPDPRAFEKMLMWLGLEPQDVLFIDDTPENCAAARALGINAYHYVNPQNLRDFLITEGLLEGVVS